MVKYGILLEVGQTAQNVAKFRVFTEPQERFIMIILEEGNLATPKNGKSQKIVTERAIGKIVEWENDNDAPQRKAINDAVTAFNATRKVGQVKITTEVMIMIADGNSNLGLGKKP